MKWPKKIYQNLKRFRVRQKNTTIYEIGGRNLIDVNDMVDGHLVCNRCGSPYFFVVSYPDKDENALECHCAKCETNVIVVLPPIVDIEPLGRGQLQCRKHPNSHMVFNKNAEIICVGCRNCDTQVEINLLGGYQDPDEYIVKE